MGLAISTKRLFIDLIKVAIFTSDQTPLSMNPHSHKLLIILMMLSTASFAQKVYQSGVYPRQSTRPGGQIIKGLLVDKFTNNGYFWYSIVDHDKMFKISVMKSEFDNAVVQSHITLDNCFKLSSQKWKCQPTKKKSSFLQRNVFFAISLHK